MTTRMLLAAALAISMAQARTTSPDAGHYTATSPTVYSFIDLTVLGGSASVLTNTDDAVSLLTLPFQFVYYGTGYNLLCVSSNGIAYFVTSAGACANIADFQNLDMSAAATPNDLPAVAPYWTDLIFQGGGAVYYQTQGAVGSRKFVVQWNNAYPQATVLSANPVTFEMVLNESSNQILFQYKTVNLGATNPANDGAQSTVGIRTTGGNTNGKVTQWSYNSPVLTDATAILFAPGYTQIPATQISVTETAPTLGRGAQYATGTITIKNIGSSTLTGPFQIVLTSLANGITVPNASGTFAGLPYLTVSTPASLTPGQSATVTVEFNDPSNIKINENTVVYSGSLQ